MAPPRKHAGGAARLSRTVVRLLARGFSPRAAGWAVGQAWDSWYAEATGTQTVA